MSSEAVHSVRESARAIFVRGTPSQRCAPVRKPICVVAAVWSASGCQATIWHLWHQVRPNPSLKPSPNSQALGRRGRAVHHQPRRPSARLSGPA